jgi:copper transport protein
MGTVLRSLHRTANSHRLVTAWLLAILLMAATLSGAQAHAIVTRSDPADGSVVTKPPHEIRLWFSEAISPQVTQARVLNVKGEAVPSTVAQVDPNDPTLLVVTVPNLPDGVYNVVYTALSAADGHVTQGHTVFKVSASGAAQAGGVAVTQPAVSLPEATLRWLDFLALAAVVGAVAVAFVLLGPSQILSGGSPQVVMEMALARRRVLRWGGWCAVAALTLGLALLLWQASLFVVPAGAGGAPGTTAAQAGLRLLTDTQSGALWILRQALLIVIAFLLFILAGWPATDMPARDPQGAGAVFGLLCVALLTTQALSGHAATVAPDTAVAIVADVLHLLAASLWVGGLLALVVGLLKPALAGRGTPAFEALVHAGWRPFGVLAAFSVGILFATGLYSTGRQVASVDALLTTFYGRTLLAKVVLVLAVGFIGLLNSSLLHPAVAAPWARLFRRPPGWTPLPLKRFPLLVATEVALGVLVFLATGLMTSAAPPHGPEFAPAPSMPGAMPVQRADDLIVVMEQVKPNLPGQNFITVRVADTLRPPPGEILRVMLHFMYQNQDVGMISADAQQVSPGVYQVAGSQLSLSGPWQVQVVVRRKGLEDSATQFTWTVDDPTPRRPVVISNRPLEPILTVAAAAIMLVVILIAALLWLRRPRSPAPTQGDARVNG